MLQLRMEKQGRNLKKKETNEITFSKTDRLQQQPEKTYICVELNRLTQRQAVLLVKNCI